MYSLDVNFLNDRAVRPSDLGTAAPRAAQSSQAPLVIGVVVGILFPALAAGLWFFLQTRNANLQEEIAQLDNELAAAQAQLQEVTTIRQQVDQINQQNQALATVFDRIKPWSAILQDVRDRVPTGVQVAMIQQIESEAPQPAPAASPPADPNQPAAPPPAAPEPPPSTIEITGQARSFNDVNDFLLTLQRSPFLNPESTRLVSAQLVSNPTEIEIAGEENQQAQVEVELPQVVEYKIESSLTPLPTSDLLQDLERTLAVGLAARIQALRDKGVIQQ
jgi:type IV pilus assembly protein PilN